MHRGRERGPAQGAACRWSPSIWPRVAEVEVQAPANTEPLLAAIERAGYDAAIA